MYTQRKIKKKHYYHLHSHCWTWARINCIHTKERNIVAVREKLNLIHISKLILVSLRFLQALRVQYYVCTNGLAGVRESFSYRNLMHTKCLENDFWIYIQSKLEALNTQLKMNFIRFFVEPIFIFKIVVSKHKNTLK